MTSIVIAAYNEAAVIGRCLDALLAGAAPGEFDVTVVANGCTDDTAEVAAPGRRTGARPVRAWEDGRPQRRGRGRGRIPQDLSRRRRRADRRGGTRHRRRARRTVANHRWQRYRGGRWMWPAGRCWYARTSPFTVDCRCFSAHCSAVASSRCRRPAGPGSTCSRNSSPTTCSSMDCSLTAEKVQVESVSARVATPRRTRDLLNRLSRVRRGNAELRSGPPAGARVRDADRLSWLRDVVLPRPWLAPAAVGYVALTVAAAVDGATRPRVESGLGSRRLQPGRGRRVSGAECRSSGQRRLTRRQVTLARQVQVCRVCGPGVSRNRRGLSRIRIAARLVRLPRAARLDSRNTRADQYAAVAGSRCRRRKRR